MKYSKYILGICCYIISISIALDKMGMQDFKILLIVIFSCLANLFLNSKREGD